MKHSPMNPPIFILGLFLLLGLPKSYSQYSEVGLGLGSFHYWGDLTEKGPVASESHLATSIFYIQHIKSTFNIRLQFNFGEISAADRNNQHFSLVQRNLHFKSKIYELSLLGEVHLINVFRKENQIGDFAPYFYAGIAGFRFNPQAEYQGVWYDLQPLGTSGQGLAAYPDRKKYDLMAISIPFGMRLEYHLSRNLSLALDLGLRKTFTDQIDDVSYPSANNSLIEQEYGEVAAALADRYGEYIEQDVLQTEGINRGNPKNNDWLGLVNLQFSYKFIPERKWRIIKKSFF